MSFEARALAWMIVATAGLIAAMAIYEHRHPCLRYSTRRVFVPEFTIYITMADGLRIPMTTPEHYEDETVCEERK